MIFIFDVLGFTVFLSIILITVIIIMVNLNGIRKSEKRIKRGRKKYSNRYDMFDGKLDEINKSLVLRSEEFAKEKILKSRVQFVLQEHYDAAEKELQKTKDTDLHHKLVFKAIKEELENVADELDLFICKKIKNNKR